MSIVVIGGGGYTAFNLVKELWKRNEVMVVISEANKKNLAGMFYLENGIKTISSIESLLLENLTKESKIVFLGGYGVDDHKFKDIELLSRAYITGVTQSLEIARKFDCEILIGGSYWELVNNASTGTNINLYSTFQSAHNKILEYYANEYRVRIKKIFLTDSYGKNDWRPKLLQTLIASSKSGEVINMGSPLQIIAPMYISDVVSDIIEISNLSIKNSKSVTYLQLLPDKIYTLEEFLKVFEFIAKKEVPIKWGMLVRNRLDIKEFPISKNAHYNSKKRITIEEGLGYVLNFKSN
jgi:hypothetical protein